MANDNIVVDEALVVEYARIKNVTTDVAREKLKENMIKEAQVDIRQQMTTLMKAFRDMSPKLQGVISREGDAVNAAKQAMSLAQQVEKQLDELFKRLDFERETYAKALKLLNGIIAEDEKTQARIAKLEKPSLFSKVIDAVSRTVKKLFSSGT